MKVGPIYGDHNFIQMYINQFLAFWKVLKIFFHSDFSMEKIKVSFMKKFQQNILKFKPSVSFQLNITDNDDSHSGKRARTTFNSDQVKQMEKIFAVTHYPDVQMRENLCRKTGLPESRIQVIVLIHFCLMFASIFI